MISMTHLITNTHTLSHQPNGRLFMQNLGNGQHALLGIKAVLSILLLVLLLMPSLAYSAIDVYEFDSEQQEQQYRALIDEFRCPKCQNQNLASSDSIISQDLKQKTYDMVQAGNSDDEIRAFMLERYGDFITYNPPIRPSTYILWYFPPILLILVLGFWIWRTRQQSTAYAKSTPTDHHQSLTNSTQKEDKDSLNHPTSSSCHLKNSDNLNSDNLHGDTLTKEEQAKLDALLAKHQTNHADDMPSDKYDLDKEDTHS